MRTTIVRKAGITVRMCQNYARIRTITVRKCQNYSRIRVRTKLSEYAPNVLKPGLFALFLLFSNFFLNSNFVRTSESELRQNGRMPALFWQLIWNGRWYFDFYFHITIQTKAIRKNYDGFNTLSNCHRKLAFESPYGGCLIHTLHDEQDFSILV